MSKVFEGKLYVDPSECGPLEVPLALIGVGTVFEEGILIEAEVTVVIDRVDPSRTPTAVPE